MVFFTCNTCGQSVKKNQVEKHRLKSRNCQSLSCMDCGKDFWGEDYIQHTKCITEDEKYSGKDYKEKVSTLKREKLQEQWIGHIQVMLANMKPNKLTDLLQCIIAYENIPRKHSKFQKFLENSIKITDVNLINEAWKVFSEALVACQSHEVKSSKRLEENENAAEIKAHGESSVVVIDADENNISQVSTESKRKKHKKKRKSNNELDETMVQTSNTNVDVEKDENDIVQLSKESKKKKHKEKRKSISEEEINNNDASYLDVTREIVSSSNAEVKDLQSEVPKSDKKKHKRSLSLENEKDEMELKGVVGVDQENTNANVSSKKKRKHNEFHNGDIPETSAQTEVSQNTENIAVTDADISIKDVKKKFKWTKAIREVLLQTAEHKLRLKPLRKKVIRQYKQIYGPEVDKEHLREKFEKECCSKFKMENDYVLLDL